MDQRVGAGAEDDDAAMDEDKVMEQSRREAEEADLARAAAASTEAGGERPQTPPLPISAGAAASSGPAAPSVNEAAVSNLTQMGFSREQALGALDACNGDADMAAAMLLGD